MYVITGATGQLGSRIVDRVLQRVPAFEVAVSVREPSAAAGLAARGVRVRRGDFTDPASLAHAFAGATRVLVVSAAIRGPEAADAGRVAVTAAAEAGAERVLYTSHQAASPDSLFAPQATHAAVESAMVGQPAAWTALRNGFYASTLGFYLPAAIASGELRLPEDGPVSWTAHDDLADAAVAVLLGDAAFDGVSPPLTAPAALDLEEVAGLLADVAGRPVRRVVVDDEEWRAAAVAQGMPAPAADFTLGMFRAARRGEFAVTDPTLEQVIGRPARSVREQVGALAGLAAQRA